MWSEELAYCEHELRYMIMYMSNIFVYMYMYILYYLQLVSLKLTYWIFVGCMLELQVQGCPRCRS